MTAEPEYAVRVGEGAISQLPVPTTENVNVVEKIQDDSTPEKALTPEEEVAAQWENLELQRDLAFKIVYFFIFFIVATFGLLYAYFKMDEKEKQKEEREARAKGAVYGNANQSTFFDFLAGQMDDPNYCVNPHARTGERQVSSGKKNSAAQGEEKQLQEYNGARDLDNL